MDRNKHHMNADSESYMGITPDKSAEKRKTKNKVEAHAPLKLMHSTTCLGAQFFVDRSHRT